MWGKDGLALLCYCCGLSGDSVLVGRSRLELGAVLVTRNCISSILILGPISP
jgi:hypothetical protein